MTELSGRVAIVTGGSRGIGLAIAEALLERGASVFICGKDPARLRSAVDALSRRGAARVNGSRADGIVADVRRSEDCRRMVAAAVERFGGLDILVNNAGVGIFKPFDQLSVEEWDTVIETNLSGVFYTTREAVPHLKQRGGGYIFNISSLAGVNPFPEGTAYNASKFGLNGFSEALMQDLRYDGIRVSYILPGSVATDFRPGGGEGAAQAWKLTPEDVAKAVTDLLAYPGRSLASRVELRPSQPPRKK